jgi:hypothetical protein
MRTLLVGILAATLVGRSSPLAPQAGMESCTDANGFGCLGRVATRGKKRRAKVPETGHFCIS